VHCVLSIMGLTTPFVKFRSKISIRVHLPFPIPPQTTHIITLSFQNNKTSCALDLSKMPTPPPAHCGILNLQLHLELAMATEITSLISVAIR
jgi:hypothetical protein